MRASKLKIIGTVDKIDMPDAELIGIPCKIDTGAESSAIHCRSYKLKEVDGEDVLIVKLLDRKNKLYNGKVLTFENFKEVSVKNSFGQKEERYLINLKVEIFGEVMETEFTLANRGKMRYPVLLGKKLLRKGYLVDVTKRNLNHKSKKAKA